MSSLKKNRSISNNNLSRRKFLGLLGATATGAVIFEACGVPEEELIVESPLNMPEDLVRGEDQWYATSCGISSYGESVLVRVMEGRAKKIAGNPDFPNSLGKQSVVSETNLQMLYHPDRITTPLYRKTKTGDHKPITWDTAISILEKGINDSKGKSTLITKPIRGLNAGLIESFSDFNSIKHLKFDSINNGLMNKTMKSVFDQDRLPYFDIGDSDLIISFGLDFLGTWGPVQYKTKFGRLKQNHGKLISIEPRMSLTSANADKWICPIPGTEMVFAFGIANHIISNNLSSSNQIKEFKNLIGDIDLSSFTDEYVTQVTGLTVKDIEYVINKINKIKESKGKILFLGGGPLEGYKNSAESMSIVFALNYLTDSVGSEGGIIFNPESPIKEFKPSEESPTIKIIDSSYANNLQEWKKETLKWESGETDLLILRGSNIIHGIPYDLTKALDAIKLKVCFTSIFDDTAEASDLILPEHNSLEDWGVDIPEPLMGYQTFLFQQPVVNSPTKGKESKPIYDSKSFYDILISLSDPMLGIKNYKELIEKFTSKLYSTTATNRQGSIIASNEKQFLEGVLSRGGWWNINTKINDNVSTQKLKSINVSNNNVFNDLNNKEFYLVPFLSNTILDGITASSPWAQGIPDPITTIAWDTWAEINPKTAEKLKLEQGDIIELISSTGKIKLPIFPHPAVHPKVIGVPIGLGHKFSGRYAAGKGANVLKICHTELNKSQTFSWAQNTVRIKKTENSKTIAKFEGTLPGGAVAVEPGFPILTVGPNQTADDALHEAHEEHMEETFK